MKLNNHSSFGVRRLVAAMAPTSKGKRRQVAALHSALVICRSFARILTRTFNCTLSAVIIWRFGQHCVYPSRPGFNRATEAQSHRGIPFVSVILRASLAPWLIQVAANTVKKLCLSILFFTCSSADAADLDLSKARVVVPRGLSGPERKAVQMLIEEVEKRSGIRWTSVESWPAESVPVIGVGPASSLNMFAGKYAREFPGERRDLPPEGYRIRIIKSAPAPAVFVAGNDARGVLFGVGRLLRTLQMKRGAVGLPDSLAITTSPKYPLRGHQLGYRPKTNSYDGWSLPVWEQYIRDLSVFGTNAVELIPPRSDDAADSPHFPLPPMEMMMGMSQLLADYGLDVWIWYPAMDQDYSDPKTVELALNEWREVFKNLPRIDAVFVPGGDPGHTQPKHLMALLEKQTQLLRRFHPKAQMWISPQSFSREWTDQFLNILRNDQPSWLGGVVFGPQVRLSLPELRAAVPRKYPIRHYPDITHSRQCQYPVPDWDMAYAITEAREVINPRPLAQAQIFRLLQPHTIGFIAYSEGCNDDVNKIVWSALGWDPEADVVGVLREYSRYFLGERYTDTFAQGLLALERNWQGPLLTNRHVSTALAQFQSMEKTASPRDLLNWRFQQALYRAYYDAYNRSRLIYETELEERARDSLRQARKTGSLAAMSTAEFVLERAVAHPVAQNWRARIFELAEALYQSIRMQLSVERYKAISIGRGANLDTVDMPLNNRLWLKQRFDELRKLPEETDRLKGIDEIVNWTNPGPGGFHDDLGNVTMEPHLVRGPGFEKDPAFLESALTGFAYQPAGPTSWWTYAESLNDFPLKMRYTNLDPGAQYKVRVVYAVEAAAPSVRLVADDTYEVHPFIKKESPMRPVEFDIPPQATADGELTLSWHRTPGLGGNGRGCQVAEVWLIKKN